MIALALEGPDFKATWTTALAGRLKIWIPSTPYSVERIGLNVLPEHLETLGWFVKMPIASLALTARRAVIAAEKMKEVPLTRR